MKLQIILRLSGVLALGVAAAVAQQQPQTAADSSMVSAAVDDSVPLTSISAETSADPALGAGAGGRRTPVAAGSVRMNANRSGAAANGTALTPNAKQGAAVSAPAAGSMAAKTPAVQASLKGKSPASNAHLSFQADAKKTSTKKTSIQKSAPIAPAIANPLAGMPAPAEEESGTPGLGFSSSSAQKSTEPAFNPSSAKRLPGGFSSEDSNSHTARAKSHGESRPKSLRERRLAERHAACASCSK